MLKLCDAEFMLKSLDEVCKKLSFKLDLLIAVLYLNITQSYKSIHGGVIYDLMVKI